MITALLFVSSYLICKIFLHFVKRIILEGNMVTYNYLGKSIPTGMGLVLSFSVIPILGCLILLKPELRIYFLAVMFSVVFITMLGLIDDFLGKKDKAKGFKGHFKNMLNGKITTGGLKAFFGVFIAFITSLNIRKATIFELLIDTLLISFMTNLINLFDLRPGRACKAFFLFAFLIILVNTKSSGNFLLVSTMGAVAAYLPFDLKGTVMMGDTGSNLLGYVLGVEIVVSFYLIPKMIITLLLISLNILSEKISFSKIISKNRVLNYLDSLGRKHV
ncbi:MAG: UDP-GlcNAc:undecaprenyl-phosphate/decaprenyl-phosphate GlcNAc-phosphate transferase [Thermosediminibacterales bacterium]|nr:UDP-GlcNAc:undecaprenyl-phosphate/decaprenyl-phosphate GlcNAc-phosphate transferase [Thermosediminibacterales bacterium]